MNQFNLFSRRNFVVNLKRLSNRRKNVLKFSTSETNKQIQMKLEISKWLIRNGKEFYTEVIFKNGNGRADVINADDQVIYEVYNTETEKSRLKKSRKYPETFEIIFVDANQKFCEKLVL